MSQRHTHHLPPNQRVFQLTSIVRDIVKEQLRLLEEPITRITVLAFKKVLEEEQSSGSNEDPFECLLGDPSISTSTTTSTLSQPLSVGASRDDVSKEEHTKIYVDDQECYLEEEESIRAVYVCDMDDDGQSQFGDMIGVLDDEDEFWESDLVSGVLVGYQREGEWVPVVVNTSIPDWSRKRKICET